MRGASFSSSPGRGSWREFVATLPVRIRAQWRLKVLLSVAVSVLFCVPYMLIGHHPLMPAHTLPLSWLDRVARANISGVGANLPAKARVSELVSASVRFRM